MTGLILLLSGCAHCGQLICRARPEDPWRALPENGKVLFPAGAAACGARPGRLPHRSPGETRHDGS